VTEPWDPYRDGAESAHDAHVRHAQQPGMRHPGYQASDWPAPLALSALVLVLVLVLGAALIGLYQVAADLQGVLP